MSRLSKILTLCGLSSVYLMQAPCTQLEHGFSVLPNLNVAIPNLLGGL